MAPHSGYRQTTQGDPSQAQRQQAPVPTRGSWQGSCSPQTATAERSLCILTWGGTSPEAFGQRTLSRTLDSRKLWPHAAGLLPTNGSVGQRPRAGLPPAEEGLHWGPSSLHPVSPALQSPGLNDDLPRVSRVPHEPPLGKGQAGPSPVCSYQEVEYKLSRSRLQVQASAG